MIAKTGVGGLLISHRVLMCVAGPRNVRAKARSYGDRPLQP